MTQGLQQLEGQSTWKLATDYVMKSYQDNILRLHSVVEARPHDVVATDELRTAMQNYFDLQDKFLAANSDAARGLRLGQERPNLNGADVKFAPSPKHTVAVEETQAVGASVKGAMQDAESAIEGIRKNTTDTNAVTAADFSLARARTLVEAARKKLATGDIQFEHDPELAVEHATDIKTQADAQRADPQTLTPEEATAAKAVKTSTTNPIEELSKLLDAQENRLDNELAKAKLPARKTPTVPRQPTPFDDAFADVKQQAKDEPNLLKPTTKPVEDLGVERGVAGPDLKSKVDDVVNALDGATANTKGLGTETVNGKQVKTSVAKTAATDLNAMGPVYGGLSIQGASVAEVQALGRIFKLSGGEPRNAEAVTKAAKVVLDGKPIRQALELFTNFLLSGPKTAQTILSSGALLNVVEPVVRMVAGAGSLNSAMIQEGADQLAGAFKFAKENAIVAAQSLREGRGILDPSPQTIAIDGTLGKVVRIPGNVAGSAHEFGKVTGYRSWVYARSLREGRAIGLSGDKLAIYTEDNLRAAFSKDGVAVVPAALKYGQSVSMSSPVRPGSFTDTLLQFSSNALIAKFVVPFAKISSNIFNYVFDATPALNMLAKRNRDIIRAGGEDAAMLHARSVVMSGLYYYGYSQAVQGNLTGRGPSDPQLRSMWLKDNQPYSFRLNAESPWHSYQRFEPLAKTLGLAADYHVISSELGDKHKDAEHMLYAGGQAIINNLTSATYMKNMAEFGGVWASENPQKLQNYLENLGGSLAVPALATSFNGDPVYRDVQNMRDAIYSRLPGYSEKIEPLFSWSGEPILKTPGTWNRNVSLVTRKDGTPTPVEQELLAMREKLEPFPKDKNGIDLSDRQAYDNGKRDEFDQPISPYRRFMELLNAPKYGPNLRDEVTELVKSPAWKDMGAGADGFPGGERMMRINRIKTRHEAEAWAAVQDEYPKLKNQVEATTRMKRAAMTTGELGVQAVEQQFGVTRNP